MHLFVLTLCVKRNVGKVLIGQNIVIKEILSTFLLRINYIFANEAMMRAI